MRMGIEGNTKLPQETGNGTYRVGYKKPPREHQFKPGNNANPGGRPKGASILGPLLQLLAAEPDESGFGRKSRELAALALQTLEAGGDITPILKLIDRTDGAVTQKLEQTGTTEIISRRVNTNDRPGI